MKDHRWCPNGCGKSVYWHVEYISKDKTPFKCDRCNKFMTKRRVFNYQ